MKKLLGLLILSALLVLAGCSSKEDTVKYAKALAEQCPEIDGVFEQELIVTRFNTSLRLKCTIDYSEQSDEKTP